jgi:bifunctional non-homologous end joining protein LigD
MKSARNKICGILININADRATVRCLYAGADGHATDWRSARRQDASDSPGNMARPSLEEYHCKRDFSRTPEPAGKRAQPRKSTASTGLFVVQKHAARRLHYDFRLEIDGVLVSWAVPKGPSLDPADKRLAVRTEDHPLEYAEFEGTIPEGAYGAGTVMIWDSGTYLGEGDMAKGLGEGGLRFHLYGKRLKGGFALILMQGPRGGGGKNWLLVKERDAYADGRDVIERATTSVKSGRTMEEIAARDRIG